MQFRRLLGGAVALLALLAPGAGARLAGRAAAPEPFAVSRASLTQSGSELVWSVTLDHAFAPTMLGADRRSLCLLIERVRTGAVDGLLCLGGTGGHPALSYARVTRQGLGPAHRIDATFSRTASDQLAASFLPPAIGLGYTATRWQLASGVRTRGCRTAAAQFAAACLSLYPAQPELLTLHSPIPAGCVPSGAPSVTSGPSTGREIALTFDDGPWYQTAQFLDVLEREHVVATFFEIGDQIAAYGDGGAIERRMLADGDMIGDHTWNHQDVAGAGPFATGEIDQTAAAIRQATGGFEPCLFRPPYGASSPALIQQARALGFTTILWDIDPRDWALPGTSAIYDNVVANAHPGAIIEQHDGGGDRSETLAALPREIATLRARGYTFVTVTQLLGQRVIYR